MHVTALDGRPDHGAGRGRAQYTGEQAFGVGDPFAVGVLVGIEALALAVGEANETLACAFFADEARRQGQQVFDLHRQQRTGIEPGAGFLANEAAGLPVFGNPCAGKDRHPDEQGEVAHQRQHHALSQRGDRQVQRVAMQPGQPREGRQRPAQAAGNQGQHQGVEPEESSHRQPCEYAAAVGLFPVQGTEHGRGQLGHGGKGDLADGCQARGGAQQPVADISQQQNADDAHPAYRQHPVAEQFEGPFGIVAAQQPGQQHVVGDHGRQCHAGDNHHAGGGRGTADKGEQGQRRVRFSQRQADHERVGEHRAWQ
ncbi:hypothetical protein D3C76_436390 [compost metagenome]